MNHILSFDYSNETGCYNHYVFKLKYIDCIRFFSDGDDNYLYLYYFDEDNTLIEKQLTFINKVEMLRVKETVLKQFEDYYNYMCDKDIENNIL